jgi:biopolymer transport protein ExbD
MKQPASATLTPKNPRLAIHEPKLLEAPVQISLRRKHRRAPAEINVTSLVDVMFNLLLFFVLSTTFSQTTGLSIDLPSAQAPDVVVSPKDTVISLTRDGVLLVEDRAISDSELDELLTAWADDPTRTIVLRADTEVPHGRVVAVLDRARTKGIRTLSIATDTGH